jgi:hypothetical protein
MDSAGTLVKTDKTLLTTSTKVNGSIIDGMARADVIITMEICIKVNGLWAAEKEKVLNS